MQLLVELQRPLYAFLPICQFSESKPLSLWSKRLATRLSSPFTLPSCFQPSAPGETHLHSASQPPPFSHLLPYTQWKPYMPGGKLSLSCPASIQSKHLCAGKLSSHLEDVSWLSYPSPGFRTPLCALGESCVGKRWQGATKSLVMGAPRNSSPSYQLTRGH